MKKYNNLLTSMRCPNKDPKDAHVLDLLVVDQRFMDESKKTSDKSNREYNKG